MKPSHRAASHEPEPPGMVERKLRPFVRLVCKVCGGTFWRKQRADRGPPETCGRRCKRLHLVRIGFAKMLLPKEPPDDPKVP